MIYVNGNYKKLFLHNHTYNMTTRKEALKGREKKGKGSVKKEPRRIAF